MHTNSPAQHPQLDENQIFVTLEDETVLEAVIRSLTTGIQDEITDRKDWVTSQQLIDSWSRRDPRWNEGLTRMFDTLAGENGEPIDVDGLERWLDVFKGVEYQELVLVRSAESPARWGVLNSGGDALLEASDSNRAPALAVLEGVEAEPVRPSIDPHE